MNVNEEKINQENLGKERKRIKIEKLTKNGTAVFQTISLSRFYRIATEQEKKYKKKFILISFLWKMKAVIVKNVLSESRFHFIFYTL